MVSRACPRPRRLWHHPHLGVGVGAVDLGSGERGGDDVFGNIHVHSSKISVTQDSIRHRAL